MRTGRVRVEDEVETAHRDLIVIVSHSARVLFVHVQKTGGSTVQSVLLERLPGAEKLTGLPGAKHARLGAALRRHPELASYWTFGFVRNPWARMWSWWSMIDRRQDQRDQGHAWATRRIDNNDFWSGVLRDLPDFEAFVLRGPDQFTRLRTPQLHYLQGRGRRADLIGRTESFTEDLRRACDHLGIEPPAQEQRRNAQPAPVGSTVGIAGGIDGGIHVGRAAENAVRSRSYRDHYTPAMRDRVADLFAADVAEFGYEF